MYRIITVGGNENSTNRMEFMVQSEEDLTDLPKNCAEGSLAYTAGFVEVWHKDLDGNWVAM